MAYCASLGLNIPFEKAFIRSKVAVPAVSVGPKFVTLGRSTSRCTGTKTYGRLVKNSNNFRRIASSRPKLLSISCQASKRPRDSGKLDDAAVFGASGRIGRLVVQRLLEDGRKVRAVVRDPEKAREVLPTNDSNLTVQVCDLTTKKEVRAAVKGAGTVFWCVSLEENSPSLLEALKGLFQQKKPKATVDRIVEQLKKLRQGSTRLVLLSSAAVTRPAWSKEKKSRLKAAVDIPIVRLNPFGTLDKQRQQEQRLRKSGVAYSIVRPVGLNSDWAPGRPVLAQGDVAVGRANPRDVADVMIAAGGDDGALGKTFEMITVQGYAPPSDGFATAFSRLLSDEEREGAGEDVGFGAADPLSPGELAVTAQYNLLMQLLPGVAQDPTRLEMGRKYEEVDSGEVNRAAGAAPTLRERQVAARLGR